MANILYDALFGCHAGQDTPFLHLPDGTVLTHDAFLTQAAQMAHVMVDAGLTPGDRVAAQIEKSPQALALYAACVQAGLIFLPLNTGYTAEELRYFIDNSGAAMVVCDSAKEASLQPMAQGLGAQVMTLDADGSGTLIDAAATRPAGFDTVARRADDLAAFLYTSGTTGRSKGAMLTQDNLLSNTEVLMREWRFDDRDVLLHALPIFHTHGLFVATNIILLAGGSMVFLPKLGIDQMVAWMPEATSMIDR
ncbi:MAG: AMP-binding protein, partial [Marinibacterium sp.]|nr:AMP-binding protein [Marinibacterium sp.]